MNERFTVRAYGRCSTDEQADSPGQQEEVCRAAFDLYKRVKPDWAEAIWGGFYFDAAITRTSKFRERPVGSLVLAGTKPDDVILCANFDRIFANVVDVCETIELLSQRNFRLSILDMDVDLSSHMGQAVFKIMAAVKELEVKEIRRRCKESKRHRRNNGLPNNQKPPVGWRLVSMRYKSVVRKFLAPDHVHRKIALDLLRLREKMSYLNGLAFRRHLRATNNRHPSGRHWSEPTSERWMQAARDGFPLLNGLHESTVPFDAEPVDTLLPNS